MTKQNILKSVVVILSLGIVLCTYLIFVKIISKTNIKTKQGIVSEINLQIDKEFVTKQVDIRNNKIYILTQSPQSDKIIVIDEEKAQAILNINLNKGDNKNE